MNPTGLTLDLDAEIAYAGDSGSFEGKGRIPGLAAIEGKLVALPVTSGAQILFYRKDLFEAKGLKVPTTMEEMARKLRLRVGKTVRTMRKAARPPMTWPAASQTTLRPSKSSSSLPPIALT